MSSQRDFSSDRHRPTFHFLPSHNWMNDPNGLIQWDGTYHLFYQYNPNGAFWGTMHWGHAMSEDLVHWRHMPVALTPEPGGPDQDGCFSGCAVNVDGVPTLMYTGVRGDDQLPCIATSHDGDLTTWEKCPQNPVISTPPSGLETIFFRDHSVWKENGGWYQVIGSGIKGWGGTALVYQSRDFYDWQYVNPLVTMDEVEQGMGKDATGWECPDFFEVDGRRVLIVSLWDHRPLRVAYMVGDYVSERFNPTNDGIVDPGESFYAPQSFTDDMGRRIMFGWLRESRSDEWQAEAGWSGVMSLPRVLSVLGNGSLATAPAPELKSLRANHVRLLEDSLRAGQGLALGDIPGDALELLLRVSPNVTGTVGIEVLRSADGTEATSVTYDVPSKTVSLDTRRSSFSNDAEGGVYRVNNVDAGERPVELHVFVDHSVVEVFVNDEKCISARAYPLSPSATGTQVISPDESPAFERVDAWEIKPSVFTA